jgi:predicted nuclease of predicted toxin-antitoxin system
MALAFLLDENLPGRWVKALERHNAGGVDLIDFIRVGEPDDLPLRTDDRTILAWAERESRILITEDKATMPTHLAEHLAEGKSSPGVINIRPAFSIPEVLDHLILIAHASDAFEWRDRIEFIP